MNILTIVVRPCEPRQFGVNEPEQSRNNRIISLTDCKKILNRNGNYYTDEEILKIRDFLIALAELQYLDYKAKQNEAGHIIHQGVDRRAG